MIGCLVHCVFLFLHFVCVLFGFFGLIITIPLHVIACVLLTSSKPTQVIVQAPPMERVK